MLLIVKMVVTIQHLSTGLNVFKWNQHILTFKQIPKQQIVIFLILFGQRVQ